MVIYYLSNSVSMIKCGVYDRCESDVVGVPSYCEKMLKIAGRTLRVYLRLVSYYPTISKYRL